MCIALTYGYLQNIYIVFVLPRPEAQLGRPDGPSPWVGRRRWADYNEPTNSRRGAMSAVGGSGQASKNAMGEAKDARDWEKEQSLTRKQREQNEREPKYSCLRDDAAKDLQVHTISAPADTTSA